MNGSIHTGSSALLAYQKAIDVESNNVANVNTIGFKSDTVSFSDLMYQGGIGKGVTMNDPTKNFTQGQLKETGLDYDFAISGEGFFTVVDPQDDSVYYTRAGNFRKDANSNLVDINEMNVMGVLPVVSGDPITSDFTKNIGSSVIEDDTTVISLNIFATDYTKHKILEVTPLEIAEGTATTGMLAGNVTVTGTEQIAITDNRNYEINNLGEITLTAEGATQINSGVDISGYQVYVTATGISGTNYKTKDSNVSDIEAVKSAYQSAISAYAKDISVGTPASVHIDEITFPLVTDGDGNYQAEIVVNGIKYQENFDTDVATTLNNLSNTINKTAGVTSAVDTNTGILTIESMIAGEKITTSQAIVNNNTLAISLVSLESGSGQNLVDALYTQLQTLIEANGGKIASIKTEIAKTPSGTAPALGKISLDLEVLGIRELDPNSLSSSINKLAKLENDNGEIYLVQGDAKFLVAKMAPVIFQESSSLAPQGQNLYSATSDSGQPLYVAEKAEILNGKVEVSSTDLAEGLVNLMIWQKAFDANSKTITTSDELLKTALALKTK
jgi:flagellar hook protein FlgE